MDTYKNNINKYHEAALRLERSSNTLSTFRLIFFLVSGCVIFLLSGQSLLLLFLIIIPISLLGFGFIVRHHTKVDNLVGYTHCLKEINEHEVLRRENKLSGFPTGHRFIDPDHPYVSDLDIFGHHSIFQLINRTTTEQAELVLAQWLSAAATKPVILDRQIAIKELSAMVDWRQHFQASGMQFRHTKSDYDNLLEWTDKPALVIKEQSKHLTMCIIMSIVSTSALVYFLSHILTVDTGEDLVKFSAPLIITLLINSMILQKFKPITDEILKNIHLDIKILGVYQSLATRIERERFQSKILRALQSVLYNRNTAKEVKRLMRILEVLRLKGGKRQFNNFFYSVANALWFMDVYLIIVTEKWKAKNTTVLKTCGTVISEFEVLSSLAGFQHSNPSFIFPEIKDELYHINLDMVGHPLINRDKRIYNSFFLQNRGNIAIVTGSNMSGKSTFLRTLGVNLVLALMGAPCCATSGSISNMKVFSSMRTQDSLEKGISSFYAELKRITLLLDLLQSGEATFFILDEMFKGTNSKDRYKGGFSLIKQLSELNSTGLISTHDIELAELAKKYVGVTNYSFNSKLRNGELVFDFVLTNGVCNDFNASELMKRSGIKIISDVGDL